jgi:DNA-binding transcriptional regulator PaaX
MAITTQEALLIQLKTGAQSLGQLVAYTPTLGSDEAKVVAGIDLLIMSGKIVSAKASEMRQHYVFANLGPKRDLADKIDARGLKIYKLA